MSKASLIKKLSRKVVELPQATRLAREAGELGPTEGITVIIRKVSVGEVTSKVGTPPQLLQLASSQEPGETPEERRARMNTRILEDGDLFRASQKEAHDTLRAIVATGVIDPKVSLTPEGEELDPSDFGGDLHYLHDQIVNFSSLPYQPLGGPALERFPGEPLADGAEPDGGEVRVPPERPLEE